jgi:hypothetical protein
MEEYPVEDRAFRMARTIYFRYIGSTDSRSVPRLVGKAKE